MKGFYCTQNGCNRFATVGVAKRSWVAKFADKHGKPQGTTCGTCLKKFNTLLMNTETKEVREMTDEEQADAVAKTFLAAELYKLPYEQLSHEKQQDVDSELAARDAQGWRSGTMVFDEVSSVSEAAFNGAVKTARGIGLSAAHAAAYGEDASNVKN